MAQQPMYQKIAEDLRRRIELGTTLVPGRDDGSESPDLASGRPAALQPGSKLPTELELCGAYAASRNTIRDAVKLLVALNLIETKPGQGSFVVRRADPFVTILSSAAEPETAADRLESESAAYLSGVGSEHRQAVVSPLKVEMRIPPPEVALRLGLKPDDQAVSRHQVRYVDDTPWSLQTSFYPMEFVTKGATELLMARDIKGGAAVYLAATLGVRQVGRRDWITTRNPDEIEQKSFGLAQDATVFVIYRTGFDQSQKPMRVTVTIFRADRNQFIVDSGDVPDPLYRSEADRGRPPSAPQPRRPGHRGGPSLSAGSGGSSQPT
jgi:GntR family transcriptional regulator